jgi:hypothetical protein
MVFLRKANMRENEFTELKQTSWRRRLTASEAAAIRQYLASQPQATGDWEKDDSLNRLLEQWPSVPVSSNFTARVVAAARRSEPAPVARGAMPWIFGRWWAQLAAGAVMVGVGFLSFQEYQSAHRARQAQELAAAGRLAALAPIEWLNDFDTIQRLDKVKVADDELLSVLE